MWPNRALLLRAHVGTFSIYSLLLAKTNPPLIYRSWQTSVSSYPLEPLEIKFKSVWSDHGFDVLRFLQNEKQNLDRPYVGTFWGPARSCVGRLREKREKALDLTRFEALVFQVKNEMGNFGSSYGNRESMSARSSNGLCSRPTDYWEWVFEEKLLLVPTWRKV